MFAWAGVDAPWPWGQGQPSVCLYTGFLLFTYLLCMCGLWMCPRLCVSRCAWGPEVDFERLSQSLSTLVLETESLIEPGPCP